MDRPLYKAFDPKVDQLVRKYYLDDPRRGIVRIRMDIKRKEKIQLSNKKIYRYMKINGYKSIIRRKKQRYNQSPHSTVPNLIKRNFKAERPNEKWSIDISYIKTTQGNDYLCAIKDMYDKSIIYHNISNHMTVNLVIETVLEAAKRIRYKNDETLILHSDQGFQFLSKEYTELLERMKIRHSVSHKGNCVDNCPIESWFSALKTESIYLIPTGNRKEMRDKVNNYIHYYNHERLQEQLKELAPNEYRKLALNY